MKNFLCFMLTIVCLLSCTMTNAVYAIEPSSKEIVNSAEAEIIGYSYSQLTNYSNVSSYGYINNWNNFTYYYTSSFSQYANGNNCGPTQVANLLSYYKSVGYIYAFPGNTITQSYYTNTICPAVGYTSTSGVSLNAAANGFKTVFESGASYYSTTVNNQLYLSWANFKSLINNNKPLLLAHQGHLYLIIGYQTRNNVNYYVALTAFSESYQRYALIGYGATNSNRKSITIN